MNKQEWESASIEEKEKALAEVGFGMMARPEGTANSLAERSWEELPRETKGMWGYHEVKGNETLAFRTNCIDGNDHKPTVGAVLDTCVKCGREIHETSEGSGYWFTDQDDRNWDTQFNGEVKADEVSLDVMHQARAWWDKKHPDRQWVDMRIGGRQRAIIAFIKDPNTVLENFIKATEENEEEDVALLTRLLDNELEEEEKGHDETEDIALVAQLLDREISEEFKEEEHPREDSGKFTSGGGTSGGAGEKPEGDLIQNIVDAGKAHFTDDRKDYRKESEQIKEGEWKRMSEQERNQALYARTKMANGGTRIGVKGFRDSIASDELPKELKPWDDIDKSEISDSTKKFSYKAVRSKDNTDGTTAKDIQIKNTRYEKLKNLDNDLWEDLDFKSGKDVYSRDGMSRYKKAIAMRLNGKYDSIDKEIGEWLTDDNFHSLNIATDELKAGIGDNEVEDWWDKSSRKERDSLMDYDTPDNEKSYDDLSSVHQLSMRARYVDRKTGAESIASESVTSWWGGIGDTEFRQKALQEINADLDLAFNDYWELSNEIQDELFIIYSEGFIGETYTDENEWDKTGIIKKQEILYALDREDVDVFTKWENLPSDLATQIVRSGALESRAKEADEDENKCEGCGRLEDYLNDESLCEDCEREAGIDRLESMRDAYEVSYNSIKNSSSNSKFQNKWDGKIKSRDEVLAKLEKSSSHKEDVWEQQENMEFNANFDWKRYTGEAYKVGLTGSNGEKFEETINTDDRYQAEYEARRRARNALPKGNFDDDTLSFTNYIEKVDMPENYGEVKANEGEYNTLWDLWHGRDHLTTGMTGNDKSEMMIMSGLSFDDPISVMMKDREDLPQELQSYLQSTSASAISGRPFDAEAKLKSGYIKCPHCDQQFSNLQYLSDHIDESHEATEGGWTDDYLSIKTPTIGDIPSFVSSMAKGYGRQLGNIIDDKRGDWKIQTREDGQWKDTEWGGIYAGKDGAEYDANMMSQITRVVKVGEAFDTDWACPRCGNKNVKIKYDENGLPVGRECPKCGLGKESYAREDVSFGDDPNVKEFAEIQVGIKGIFGHERSHWQGYEGLDQGEMQSIVERTSGQYGATSVRNIGGGGDGKGSYGIYRVKIPRENESSFISDIESNNTYRDSHMSASLVEYTTESYAKEDGMYANFGDKDKDDSWTVLTVASDLLYFNSREEAEDYTKNFPSDTYQINPPRAGESRANEGVQYEFSVTSNNPNIDIGSVVMRYGGTWNGSKASIPYSRAYDFEQDLKKFADVDYQITQVTDVPVNAQGYVLDAYHPDYKKEDWESLQPVIPYAKEEAFKEEEHPREDSGKFTSGGGSGGASSGKHSKTSTKDLIKSIKGGNKDWHSWGRNEKTEELYAEIEKRNREIPTPTSKLGGKVFRDDPDAVSKMEQKVKYWEDQQAYWKKVTKFPNRDYQTPNQLGDARWFMTSNTSTNLRDAKKKLEGIKSQQGRGTDLVRKPTYKDGKKRFYYSEEPKGEPKEEPWQKGGEYADINKILKKSLEYEDSDRKVSPNSLMRYTEPINLPTGKNALDQTWGTTEPETPDGQDLTGKTIGEEEDSEYERIRGLIDMSEMPETVEDLERWASRWGADKDLVKKVFDQEFGTYEGDEEIKEKKPFKPTYLYYKQHPFGVRKDTDSPFGEAVPKTFQTFNSLLGATEEADVGWGGHSCPDCGLVFGDGEEERKNLAYHREEKHGVPVDPSDSFGYEGGQGSGRKPTWKSEDPKTKEKHHVGWKNYGIDDYIDKAFQDYTKKSEEEHAFADMTEKELEELGKKESEPHISVQEGRWDDAPLKEEDDPEFARYLSRTQLKALRGTDNPKELQNDISLDAYASGFDWQEGQERTPMNSGKVNIKKISKNKTLITPDDDEVKATEDARWSGDQNNPNRDLSDPNWISSAGWHAERSRGSYGSGGGGSEFKPFWKCPDCGKKFRGQGEFIGHLDEVHDYNHYTAVSMGNSSHYTSEAKFQRGGEGGKGSGKSGHQGWMRAIEEDHTYDFCENCNMITEQVNHKCDICGKTLKV